jgi:octaprenyl-diphosphate synthase
VEFSEIYLPITKELREVEAELKAVMKSLGGTSARDIFKYFFSDSEKYLRPILALLSAKAINNQLPESVYHELTQLCVGIELIHNASLIHDDIIDGDSIIRNQQALNKVYGNKIAILAGDSLYSRAFFIFSDKLPKIFSKTMVKVIKTMSMAEILNARTSTINREMYLKIVEGKTAFFMSVCCGLGATLAGANEKEINALSNYGHNLGIAYQILNDYIDKDPVAIKNISIEDAFKFASTAKDALKNIKNSIYIESLINLVDYVLDFYEPTIKMSSIEI